MTSCPCGSGRPYDLCCGPFHRGEAGAPTAEALMRSRYSAFALGDAAYLVRTWHPRTRPKSVDTDLRWVRLEVLGSTGGSLFDTDGTVRFQAHHTGGVMRENSRFVRENGAWLYVAPVL